MAMRQATASYRMMKNSLRGLLTPFVLVTETRANDFVLAIHLLSVSVPIPLSTDIRFLHVPQKHKALEFAMYFQLSLGILSVVT